jgi:hypothetical protein
MRSTSAGATDDGATKEIRLDLPELTGAYSESTRDSRSVRLAGLVGNAAIV